METNATQMSPELASRILGRAIADVALDTVTALCAGSTYSHRFAAKDGSEWASVTFAVRMQSNGCRSPKACQTEVVRLRREALTALLAAGHVAKVETLSKRADGTRCTTAFTYLANQIDGVRGGIWVKL